MWQQNLFKRFKKKLRVEVTLELLNKINNDSKLPEGVITNNETYVYECNLQINAQSSAKKRLGEVLQKILLFCQIFKNSSPKFTHTGTSKFQKKLRACAYIEPSN